MMNKIIAYAKTHKLIVFLIALVIYLLFKGLAVSSVGSSKFYSPSDSLSFQGAAPMANVSDMALEVAPTPSTQERRVVTNSNFSLLVKDVSDSIEKIKAKATMVSGYVIDINISRGESSESAYLTLRIPNNSVDDVTKYLRSISAKVVSENITGTDITDQYVDVETRIAELLNVKSKLNQIMDKATTSDEMLRVFSQINNINTQIDSYKGQLKYMDASSSTSKLTIALSTDELSLPYAPAQPWRPEVIFKTAVRSLLGTLQSIGTVIIWAAVYLPLILVVFVVYIIIKKRRSKTKTL